MDFVLFSAFMWLVCFRTKVEHFCLEMVKINFREQLRTLWLHKNKKGRQGLAPHTEARKNTRQKKQHHQGSATSVIQRRLSSTSRPTTTARSKRWGALQQAQQQGAQPTTQTERGKPARTTRWWLPRAGVAIHHTKLQYQSPWCQARSH